MKVAADGAKKHSIPLKTHGRSYMYAIAEAGQRIVPAAGILGSEVFTIVEGQVAAIVSGVPSFKIRPERAHLASHQAVLRYLMAETTVLPIAFGTIAASPEAIRKILFRNQRLLRGQLERVAGKVEMGLRVTWDVPNIFEYFVNTHAELRMARDLMAGSRGEPSQEEKIELGRLFDRLLTEDRERHVHEVRRAVSPACFDIKSNPCRNEREVMNLACLVGRSAQKEFDAAVFDAAKLFDNHFTFDYNGPWAPHNFVEIDLEQ